MLPHSPCNQSEARDQFVKQVQLASRTNRAVSSAVRVRSLPRFLWERVTLTARGSRAGRVRARAFIVQSTPMRVEP